MRQKAGTVIALHKKVFDDKYQAMIGAGVPEYADRKLAILFMWLAWILHATQTCRQNCRTTRSEASRRVTLHTMYDYASSYVMATSRMGVQDVSMFTLADDMSMTTGVPPDEGWIRARATDVDRNGPRGQSRGRRGTDHGPRSHPRGARGQRGGDTRGRGRTTPVESNGEHVKGAYSVDISSETVQTTTIRKMEEVLP